MCGICGQEGYCCSKGGEEVTNVCTTGYMKFRMLSVRLLKKLILKSCSENPTKFRTRSKNLVSKQNKEGRESSRNEVNVKELGPRIFIFC